MAFGPQSHLNCWKLHGPLRLLVYREGGIKKKRKDIAIATTLYMASLVINATV